MPANKKKLPIVALVLTSAIVIGLLALQTSGVIDLRPDKDTSTATKSPENQPTKQQLDAKQTYLDENKTPEKPTDQSQEVTTKPGATSSIELSASKADRFVTVLTKLINVSTGECKMTAKNGDKKTSQTVAVIYQPEFSSCAGFSINTDALGNGSWVIDVVVINNGETITQSSASLEVR